MRKMSTNITQNAVSAIPDSGFPYKVVISSLPKQVYDFHQKVLFVIESRFYNFFQRN